MKVTVDSKGILVLVSQDDIDCLQKGSLVSWNSKLRVAVTREDLSSASHHGETDQCLNGVCPVARASSEGTEDESGSGCDC